MRFHRKLQLPCGLYVFLALYCAHHRLTRRSTRTPTRAKATPLSWPLLVPCGLTASGAG